MNQILKYALRVLGGWLQTKILVAGFDDIVRLDRGVWEINVANGWAYYRPGTAGINLDSGSYPRASTNASWVTPEQPAYLFVERSMDWRFLVEEGTICQVIHRASEFD